MVIFTPNEYGKIENSAHTPQVNSNVSNIIVENMQIEPPGEPDTPSQDNLYPPIQFNIDANTNRMETNQIDTLNSKAMDNRKLLPNIAAIVSTTNDDVIEKQTSVSVGLPIDDVTSTTSIDTTIALQENQLPGRRRPRKQSFANLIVRPEDDIVFIPEHSNKENRKMQNSRTSKLLRCNKRTVAATLDKIEPSVKRIKTIKQVKEQTKKKPMQTRATPNRRCRSAATSYKEDSDEDASSNDSKIDQNITETTKTPNDTNLKNARPNTLISADRNLKNPNPKVYVNRSKYATYANISTSISGIFTKKGT